MRLLIISDIHANLTAFETVLAHAKGEWDEIWCLGDLVGYGPDPNACIELLREHPHISLSGNHDWAVLAKLDAEAFNHDARVAIRWTQERLTSENHAYLDALPSFSEVSCQLTLAHASPREPVWEYIVNPATALANFTFFDTPICLVGHTHIPAVFELSESGILLDAPRYGERTPLDIVERRHILNPGSVGQPRDDDPRAAYALLDSDNWTWEQRRIHYDIAATQARMRKNELPNRLILRLDYGW